MLVAGNTACTSTAFFCTLPHVTCIRAAQPRAPVDEGGVAALLGGKVLDGVLQLLDPVERGVFVLGGPGHGCLQLHRAQPRRCQRHAVLKPLLLEPLKEAVRGERRSNAVLRAHRVLTGGR